MRILILSDVYFPRVNGVSTSIRTFRSAFLAAGHTVTLIAPDYGEGQSGDDDEIIRIPSQRVAIDPEDRRMQCRAIGRLTGRLRERDYDIVHIHTPFVAHYAGRQLARRLGVPVVETYHTFFEEYLFNYVLWLPKGLLRALARRFSRIQCNQVGHVIVPSRPMHDVLERYGVKQSMTILPTGIDLEELRGGDGQRFRARHGIDQKRRVMLYVGRLAFEKNIHFLLDVLAHVKRFIPDVLLVLAGEGPARASLSEAAAWKGLQRNILFVGYLERGEALNDCYRAGDLFVFASRTETQGLVLLEAMALGLPVVSTAVMGTRDVLRDGHGCRVADEHPERFGRRVVELLVDDDARAALAASARDHARVWSAPVMAERMVALYQSVCERGVTNAASGSGFAGTQAPGVRRE